MARAETDEASPLTPLEEEMLAALRSAVASFEQLVALNRIPENMKGLRDSRAAITKAESLKAQAAKADTVEG